MIDIFNKILDKTELIIKKPKPEEIFFLIFAATYKCNSKCKMCNIWTIYKTDPEKAKNELSFEEIKNFFESSRYLRKLKWINLTGGEPFLRNDFSEICTFLMKLYPKSLITIPTNAIVPELVLKSLKKIQKEAKNAGKIFLTISIDGIDKKHDEIRGISGAFRNAIDLILKLQKNFPLIKLGIGFTLTPWNCDQLKEVYKLSNRLKINFGLSFPSSSEIYFQNTEKKFWFSSQEIKKISEDLNEILRDVRKKHHILQRIASIYPLYFFMGTKFLENSKTRNFHCYAGTHSFFLDPYGNIFPCVVLNKPFGNIRISNFENIWFSSEATKIRNFIKNKKCACCIGCETPFSLSRNLSNYFRNIRNI